LQVERLSDEKLELG